MKRILLLLCLLLILPVWASAVVTVPDGITEIGDEAFAGTDIDALIIPASVQTVGNNILFGSNAAYIWVEGENTQLASGAANGVAYVFGFADSAASSMSNSYPLEQVGGYDGILYYIGDTAVPLCAESPATLSGSVTVPKILDDVYVTSLDTLYLIDPGAVELVLPRYLAAPDGVSSTTYETMFMEAPTANVTTIPAGKYVTWTAGSVEGACGDLTYTWTFDVNGTTESINTIDPTVKYAPMAEGECIVTVTATDSLGDWASASSEPLTVTEAQPVYRALLVGNTYTGASNELKGPDNDLVAMTTMLNTMTGTPYKITTAKNITGSGMQAAIASAFSGAEPGDFSLFYYSGHGTEAGALVGINNTYLTVYALRTALQKIPGTKIVILDCCYSGAAINKSTSAAEEVDLGSFNRAVISALTAQTRSSENLADGGYIVLTACRKDQQSVSLTGDSSYYWGVFTYGICYGSGYDEWNRVSLGRLPADADGNGVITLGEAHQGVSERVAYLNTITYVDQVVQYYGDSSFVLWKQ